MIATGAAKTGAFMAGVFDVTVETVFCAAHALRDYNGRTEPTHGHNFRVIVTVTARSLNRDGTAVDFLKLKPVIDAQTARMNERFLNEDVPEFRSDGGGLSPSAENIAYVLFQGIKAQLPGGATLASVQVFETVGCSAIYREE